MLDDLWPDFIEPAVENIRNEKYPFTGPMVVITAGSNNKRAGGCVPGYSRMEFQRKTLTILSNKFGFFGYPTTITCEAGW